MTTYSTSNETPHSGCLPVYKILTAFVLSTVPFWFHFGNAAESPFLFGSTVSFSNALLFLLVALWQYLKHIKIRSVWTETLRSLKHWSILLFGLCYLDMALYALSMQYIGVSVATVLLEVRHVMFPLLFVWLYQCIRPKEAKASTNTTESNGRAVSYSVWLVAFIMLIGIWFVAYSQKQPTSGMEILLGWGFVLLAALITMFPHIRILIWMAKIKPSLPSIPKKCSLDIFLMMTGLGVLKLVGGGASLGFGIWFGETLGPHQLSFSIACGLVGLGAGLAMLAGIHLLSTSRNIGALVILMASPTFSLIGLGLLSLLHLPRIDYLVMGMSLILGLNLLLHFKASSRRAYIVFVIALLACGTAAYRYDGYPLVPFFDYIAISATVFILILSFRVDRMVRRTGEEESITVRLFRKFTHMNMPNQKAIFKCLMRIDECPSQSDLHDAYHKLRALLKKHSTSVDGIVEVESEIDSLVHSKQQGINFGEIMALGLVGIMLVASLLLFQPPNMMQWSALAMRMSSFILASVILFLFFNIIDLQGDRHQHTMNQTEIPGDYVVNIRDIDHRRQQQWVSAIVCVTIIAAYGGLLWWKWVGQPLAST